MAQLIGCPAKQKVASSVPGQGTCLGCRFRPWLSYVQKAAHECFSHPCFFSLSPFPFSKRGYRVKKCLKKKANKTVKPISILSHNFSMKSKPQILEKGHNYSPSEPRLILGKSWSSLVLDKFLGSCMCYSKHLMSLRSGWIDSNFCQLALSTVSSSS